MLFIEVLRLALVLLGALAGLEIGRSVNDSPAPVVGMVLAALVAYVLGGMLGRTIVRQQQAVIERAADLPPGELFAGTLTGIAGLLLGAALTVPLLVVVRATYVYPLAAAIAWICAWFAYRIGAAKGRQVVAAAGLSRILSPPTQPPPGYALLVDTSAAMDRSLLVLGRAGLMVGGLVVPRFVVDQMQALVSSPDLPTARRARRGLESLEALRALHVPVHIAENELPEIDDLDARLVEISRRLGLRIATCSSRLLDAARRGGTQATDLRQVAADFTPDYPPGEQLVVDLVKDGEHPRQAVGYLPDGDMVVVNDAAHLVGHEHVVVEVRSTRHTSQGLLVFAHLAPRPGTGEVRSDPVLGTPASGGG